MNIKSLIEDKKNLFTLMLCALVMLAVTHTSIDPIANAKTINLLEIIFVLAAFFTLNDRPSFNFLTKEHPVVSSLILFWAASVLMSFYFSPYQVYRSEYAWQRLYQTLSHVLVFGVVWYYINRLGLKFSWVIYAVAISSLIVILVHAAVLTSQHIEDPRIYFQAPPLNSHIRHTGYQVTAAICLLLPMIYRQAASYAVYATYAILLALFAFLLWLGGRGAVISVGVAIVSIAVLLILEKQSIWRLLAVCTTCFLLGMVISEYLAVFDWNGFIHSWQRTVAANDLNQISTGRMEIWKSVIVSVKDHPWFGLGPQGYIFMPNRLYGVQPHSFIFQFLAEWGLIGTILFLTLLVYGFFAGLRQLLQSGFNNSTLPIISAGALIVAMVFHALFDGIFYHPQPSLYLAIAFAVWISRKESIE